MLGNAIEAILGPQLADFERIDDLRWVSAARNEIRRVFEFEALKGATYSARWGFSVEFVPMLVGRKISWKKSAHKATFDLCIDPIDELGSVPHWCSFVKSSSDIQRAKIASESFKRAQVDLNCISSMSDLAQLFRDRSVMTFRRFSLANYVQTDLAWGLVLLACGNEEGAAGHLEKFCDEFGIASDSSIIRKAQQEARTYSTQSSPISR